MSGSPDDAPRVERVGDEWHVHVAGEAEPFRVVAWQSPTLVLARGNEVRSFSLAGRGDHFWIGRDGRTKEVDRRRSHEAADVGAGAGDLTSPMPGKVLEVLVAEGDEVEAGARLMVLEAMKMESPVRSPHAGRVTHVHVAAGDSVGAGDPLVEVEPLDEPDA